MKFVGGLVPTSDWGDEIPHPMLDLKENVAVDGDIVMLAEFTSTKSD
jgi:hypothetical protein